MKALRCLCPPEALAVDLIINYGSFCPLDTVNHRQRGNCAFMMLQGAKQPIEDSAIHKRPGGIMDQNNVWCSRAQCGQTVHHRGLSVRAAENCGRKIQALHSRCVQCLVIRVDNDAHRINSMICIEVINGMA